MAIVGSPAKIKKPVEFLTTQTKLDIDAVNLVEKATEEFSV